MPTNTYIQTLCVAKLGVSFHVLQKWLARTAICFHDRPKAARFGMDNKYTAHKKTDGNQL